MARKSFDLGGEGFDADTTGKDLDAVDVNRVDRCAIVGEEGGERSTYGFRSVDYGDGSAKETVTAWEDGVVHVQIFQNFDEGEWGTREDRLLRVVQVGLNVTLVVIHSEEVGVTQALNVFLLTWQLLNVCVTAGLMRENRVIDNNSVNIVVLVGSEDSGFELCGADFA